jgi:hypothetical protein
MELRLVYEPEFGTVVPGSVGKLRNTRTSHVGGTQKTYDQSREVMEMG